MRKIARETEINRELVRQIEATHQALQETNSLQMKINEYGYKLPSAPNSHRRNLFENIVRLDEKLFKIEQTHK